MLHKIRGFFLGILVFCIYSLVRATWRIRIEEAASMKEPLLLKKPLVLAHFHGDEIALLALARRYRCATMISTSKDGEMMRFIFGLMGGKSSRGSSTRGGVSALKGLLGLIRTGRNASIAVDGPKGPLHEIKPGVFELSRLLKSEIYTGGVYCSSAWHFPKSWNQTYFPKPFAKIIFVWTGPTGPITKSEDPRSSELSSSLQQQLFAARQQAANIFLAEAE
jgi:lysophospholipid acyltransferase (LPLAT)-like uncharacterized protein